MLVNASGIGFLVLFFFVFLMPGLLLCVIAGLGAKRFLFSVGLSYAINVLVIFCGRVFGLSIDQLVTTYFVIITVLVAVAIVLRRKNLSLHFSLVQKQYWIGVVGIVLVIVFYVATFGTYMELPADIFIHLEFVRVVVSDIADGKLYSPENPTALLGKQGHYWYYTQGLLTHVTGLQSGQSLTYSILAVSILLVVGIFHLSLTIFSSVVQSAIARTCIALLVALLFSVHFGVNVFSFVRYYTFAPTALNMVVYFAAVSVFIRFATEQGTPIRYLVILAVCIYTAAMVHVQEAVFIAVMGLLMLSYVVLARRFGYAGNALIVKDSESSEYYIRRGGFDRMVPHGWLVLTGLIIILAAFFWSHFFIESSTPRADNKLVILGSIWPALKGWYILSPTYQFFRVVTPWGLLVYVLFFWHWKDFRGNPFLVAGMLSPLFTVFNPLFVDLFLRHTTYITLWRFCYMIPLVFVAGFLFYKAFTRFRYSTMVGKAGYGFMAVGLVALLFPIQVGSFTVPYSRMQTLMPVKKENSPEHWADMLDYLRTLPKREQILTDPVTGYFVSALTKHHSPRYKFFKLRYKQFNFDSYEDKPLAKYKNWLVIVNQRDGGHSRTGELSRHWSADVLKVSRHYKPQLITHLKDNPNRFKELWATEDIKVYRILE